MNDYVCLPQNKRFTPVNIEYGIVLQKLVDLKRRVKDD